MIEQYFTLDRSRQFLRETAIADSGLEWRIVVVTHTVHNGR
ncbi:hypothetical protein MGWOODY_XGa2942 [hydrothermal vent metagenome]|uniref:Uncharacterized protein n=1 Tax=hydrothermal vent metagenome TaxID=652676 RepID=A0A160TT38_9ZZZZ